MHYRNYIFSIDSLYLTIITIGLQENSYVHMTSRKMEDFHLNTDEAWQKIKQIPEVRMLDFHNNPWIYWNIT